MASAIYDLDTLIMAGINPKNGLPIKITSDDKAALRDDIKRQLDIIDEQDAINRYVWYNLPDTLDGNLLERILYYRGQGMFFKIDNRAFFLPYSLDGEIDVYGRYLGVTPVPFNGSTKTSDKVEPWIQGLTRIPVYTIAQMLTMDKEMPEDCCVLLRDYSAGMSQTITPRHILQQSLLSTMAEIFPLARTSLIANCGVKAMRVQDEDQQSNVKAASRSIYNSAIKGDPLVPIVGSVEFQELTNGSPLSGEEYLIMLQAMDNYRLSMYGLKTGGLFQKQSHMLQSEQDMNAGNTGLIMQDGLTLRQNFCNIVNLLFDYSIWCEPSETTIGVDRDMNGVAQDEMSPSTGESETSGGDEDGSK